ncbi:MAG TPA: hypothetical protein VNO55_13035 [Polyangia bacterium]|nr:hypothetical protein [Polyangia bacterium]
MRKRLHSYLSMPVQALTLTTLAACQDPFKFDATKIEPQEEEICAASSEWLPNTPGPSLFLPLPHPETECPFYRGGWQNFLLATQPDAATGEPALKAYPTIDDVFDSKTPHGVRGTAQRAWLGDIKQAGGRQILIDQNGHTIYYGIHVNQAFADFIRGNGLQTVDAIKNADPNLFFPAGVTEFKSAWQEVDASDPTLSDYISTKAWVPTLSQVNGQIHEDKDHPREITVRLLALHVVFTLPGHPEFIWATFEHSTGAPDLTAADGKRNVAPLDPRDQNPSLTDPNNKMDQTVVSDTDHILYHAGTTLRDGNTPIDEKDLTLDPATQKFRQTTSVYRMFPASKSNTTHPDDAITSLNFNVQTLFERKQAELHRADRRGHYRLVGAVWMDKPRFFAVDSALQNDRTSPLIDAAGGLKAFEAAIQKDGSDSEFSILAGEDRLSSTAMESFTQAPVSFPNCFSCHNTQAITAKGVPVNHDSQGIVLVQPKQLNISHVLSQFVLEETTTP